ncbi:MAG: hypothetical protein ACYTAS_15245 [Planctomycetota bacterium]|jgi:hypothetical protein
MTQDQSDPQAQPIEPGPAHSYRRVTTVLHNLPYLLMLVLGAATLSQSLRRSAWGNLTAVGYVLYGLAGVLWIMLFVCPFCRFWGSPACPCGYGKIAARLRARQPGDRFREKFRKHIPVIVPLWFLPLMAAVPAIIVDFRWGLAILVLVFVVEAFAVLPWVSLRYGCRDCPQREGCPWMGGKPQPSPP